MALLTCQHRSFIPRLNPRGAFNIPALTTVALTLLLTTLMRTAHLVLSMAASATACIFAGTTLHDKHGGPRNCTALAGKSVAIYFAGEWCPLCRRFTPSLREFHDRFSKQVEIVFVSSDADDVEAQLHYRRSQGDWLALDWADPAAAQLKRR